MPATPQSVSRLRHEIADFADEAGVADPPLADVKLAVSEAVGNAVVHSYRFDPEPGTVQVIADWTEHALNITVCDEGVGCEPRTDSPGLGLGLGLIETLTDSFEIRARKPHGTELHMCFTLMA